MLNQRPNLTKKNFVLFVYVVILSLIGPLIYWFGEKEERVTPQVVTQNNEIQNRISMGDKVLVTADNNPEKLAGARAFANGDYATALAKFNSSLKINRNDPETLIYLNNTAAATTENTVKIAVSVPIGANLNVAKEILRGVAQAQQEINQNGGIDSKLISVEIINDENSPNIAKQVAAKLVEDGEVLAVIGHNDSNTTIAAAPIYQQSGLVMITPTSSAEIIPEIGKYIFRATPSTRALAENLAEYAVNTSGKTNIAICTDAKSEVSQSFQEEFTWAAYNRGGKIVPTECDFSAPDFNPNEISSRAISDGADALLLTPSVRRVDKAIEVAQANQERLTLLGNHSMNTYATLQQGQITVNGLVLAVPWHPEVKPNNPFAVNARKLWGGRVNWRTAMAYDAAKTVFAAIKFGSTREQLQQVMSNFEFSADGSTSKITFLPSGDRNLKGILVRVQPDKRSETGYDFVPFQP